MLPLKVGVNLLDRGVLLEPALIVPTAAGLIGVNLWPQEPNRRYLLSPRSMFCEFLPESILEEETPHTLLMEEVKEGHSYELVITNASGLFRSAFCVDKNSCLKGMSGSIS